MDLVKVMVAVGVISVVLLVFSLFAWSIWSRVIFLRVGSLQNSDGWL